MLFVIFLCFEHPPPRPRFAFSRGTSSVSINSSFASYSLNYRFQSRHHPMKRQLEFNLLVVRQIARKWGSTSLYSGLRTWCVRHWWGGESS
jgi:hypothetical protein